MRNYLLPSRMSATSLARVLVIALAMLTILGCSSADEATTTTTTQATPTSSTTETTTATTEETTSEAQPTPVQGGVVLNERVQTGGTTKTSRPALTREFIERMDTLTVEEVLANFPRKFAAEFQYDDIKRGGIVRIATTWDISKWDPRMTAAGGTMAVPHMVSGWTCCSTNRCQYDTCWSPHEIGSLWNYSYRNDRTSGRSLWLDATTNRIRHS